MPRNRVTCSEGEGGRGGKGKTELVQLPPIPTTLLTKLENYTHDELIQSPL